jgi:hypothetical protein
VAVTATNPESSLRSAYRLGATGVLAGIALAVSASPDLGGVLVVTSVAWLVWTLHRFGRLGPD